MNNNVKSILVLSTIIFTFLLPGCLQEDPNESLYLDSSEGIRDSGDIVFSFESTPYDSNSLGIIMTSFEVPARSLDVNYILRNESVWCHGVSCVVGYGEEFTIVVTDLSSCFDECNYPLEVYYLGELVISTEAIQF